MKKGLYPKLIGFTVASALVLGACFPQPTNTETKANTLEFEAMKWEYFCKDGYPLKSYTVPEGSSSVYNHDNGKWYHTEKWVEDGLIRVNIQIVLPDGTVEGSKLAFYEGQTFFVPLGSSVDEYAIVPGGDVALIHTINTSTGGVCEGDNEEF